MFDKIGEVGSRRGLYPAVDCKGDEINRMLQKIHTIIISIPEDQREVAPVLPSE